MSNTDYRAENPFEEEDLQSTSPPPALPTRTVAPSFTQAPPPLPSKPSAHASMTLSFPGESEISNDTLDRKERELNQREQNLKFKEANLTQRENELRSPPAKNWPRCRPIIYHDIRQDIPTPELQVVVRRAYWGWYALSLTYLWNFITTFAILVVDSSGSSIGGFILSILYLLVSTPVGFLIYRSLYRGAKNAKASWFVLYFCLVWLEIAVWIIYAIGLSGSGGVGFFTMIKLFNDDYKAVGIMCLVTFILWIVIIIYHIYVFVIARLEYRKLGGLRQAQKEAAKETGRQAANNPELVKAAIQASV